MRVRKLLSTALNYIEAHAEPLAYVGALALIIGIVIVFGL